MTEFTLTTDGSNGLANIAGILAHITGLLSDKGRSIMMEIKTKEQAEELGRIQKRMWRQMKRVIRQLEGLAHYADKIDASCHDFKEAIKRMDEQRRIYEMWIAPNKWEEERSYRVYFSGMGITGRPYSDTIDISGRFMLEIEEQADHEAEKRNAKVTRIDRITKGTGHGSKKAALDKKAG